MPRVRQRRNKLYTNGDKTDERPIAEKKNGHEEEGGLDDDDDEERSLSLNNESNNGLRSMEIDVKIVVAEPKSERKDAIEKNGSSLNSYSHEMASDLGNRSKEENIDEAVQCKEIRCSECEKEIDIKMSIAPIFICVECDSPQVQLCLSCFANRAEPHKHSTKHAYRIRSSRPEVFEKGWTARDEFLLLDAIERYGLGNWTNAAEAVGRGHSEHDCERHYYQLYAGRAGFFLPARFRRNHSSPWLDISSLDDARFFDSTTENPSSQSHTLRPDGKPRPPRPELGQLCHMPTALNESFVAKEEDALQKNRKALPGAELIGYMPLRGDFDVEHDNHAETLVADLEFRTDDSPDDRQLKKQVVRAYEERLVEREKRKHYVLESGLLDYKKRRAQEADIPADRRNIERQFTSLARFHDPNAHASFIDGILAADRLKRRLDAAVSQINVQSRQMPPQMNRGTTTSKRPFSSHSTHLPSQMPPPSSEMNDNFAFASSSTMNSIFDDPSNHIATLHKNHRNDSNQRAPIGGHLMPDTHNNNNTGHLMPDDTEDESQLLSRFEHSLCNALQLPPKKFLEVKESLATGIFTGRGTAAIHLGSRHQLDHEKAARLYDFAVAAGWMIHPRAPPPQPSPTDQL